MNEPNANEEIYTIDYIMKPKCRQFIKCIALVKVTVILNMGTLALTRNTRIKIPHMQLLLVEQCKTRAKRFDLTGPLTVC